MQTEVPPYYLDKAKQMFEQENLRFVPEEWGMKRSGRDEDFMFLNLVLTTLRRGAFRVVLQLDGEGHRLYPRYWLSPSRR